MNIADPDMPRAPHRKHHVLLVDTGQDSAAHVAQVIAEMGQFALDRATQDEVHRKSVQIVPDMIILDISKVGSHEMEVISGLRANFGETPIVVVSEALEESDVRKLLKQKVHDWLKKPVVPGDLLSSIESGIRSSKQNTNRVHAVISAVGGAGATTVAVNLADILSQGKKTDAGSIGLFDLDFTTGGCGALLNMSNGVSLHSVASNPGRIDSEFVSLIQQRHEHGFAVYSFKRPELVTHLNCYELVLRLLDAVTMQQAHTILDIPYYETDWRADLLAAVNSITLVTDLSLPSIKHTLDILHTMEPAKIGKKPVNVLINKDSHGLFSGRRIKEAKLRELFGAVPFHFLPADPANVAEAMDRGLCLSDLSSSSKFLKALTKYAKTAILAEPVDA